MPMESFGNQPETTAVERSVIEIVEQWKRGPTVLASSSEYRREQLEELGFSDVSFANAIPENVETDEAAKHEQYGGAPQTHWDSDGRNAGEWIARAKVQHVLNTQDIPDDALIIAFDTTPVIFDTPTDEQFMGVPKSAEKYDTIETARAGIFAQLLRLAEGIAEVESGIIATQRPIKEQSNHPEISVEEALDFMRAGQRRGNIYISTGAAISFPTEHDTIHRFSEELQLRSGRVEAIGTDHTALETVVEELLDCLGERVLAISGGIDYSDDCVKDVLQLRPAHPFQNPDEEHIYKGFAPKAVAMLLEQRATALAVGTPDV